VSSFDFRRIPSAGKPSIGIGALYDRTGVYWNWRRLTWKARKAESVDADSARVKQGDVTGRLAESQDTQAELNGFKEESLTAVIGRLQTSHACAYFRL
jgi:hypothetical protein